MTLLRLLWLLGGYNSSREAACRPDRGSTYNAADLDRRLGQIDGAIEEAAKRGEARRELADKYADFGVEPQAGLGSIRVGGTQVTGFKGAITHLAIWNRLLSADEIASIWTAGGNDLRDTAMYHSYA